MANTIELSVIEAIESKRLISFRYNKKNRRGECYVLGLNKKGDFLVRIFEVPTSGWKLFRLDKLERVKLLDQSFITPAVDYNRRNDKSMEHIVVQAKF